MTTDLKCITGLDGCIYVHGQLIERMKRYSGVNEPIQDYLAELKSLDADTGFLLSHRPDEDEPRDQQAYIDLGLKTLAEIRQHEEEAVALGLTMEETALHDELREFFAPDIDPDLVAPVRELYRHLCDDYARQDHSLYDPDADSDQQSDLFRHAMSDFEGRFYTEVCRVREAYGLDFDDTSLAMGYLISHAQHKLMGWYDE